MGLSSKQTEVIKSTVPVLAEHGLKIITTFYHNLLTDNPDLYDVFNITDQKLGLQQRALTEAVYAYAQNIDNLEALGTAVEHICNKHASLFVQKEHYEVVGTYLLSAMKEILGNAFTPEIHDAWAAAYWQLADLMVAREAELYQQSHGWTSWRKFKVIKKVRESSEVTSFYIAPEDGKPLQSFQPGQYISVRVPVPEIGHLQARQYSLSDKPSPDYYRISVRREPAVDDGTKKVYGYVSNILHDSVNEGDVLDVSCPAGDFVLLESSDAPKNSLVFISAGIGLTPFMSMVNDLVLESSISRRQIHFIHCAHDAASRAFADHMRALQSPLVQVTLFNSSVGDSDVQGKDYDFKGRLDLKKLDKTKDLHLSDEGTQYYICGPGRFMSDTSKVLGDFGVDSDKIKMEVFNTGSVQA
ncbi:globin-like protein [Dipodascopsis uninucleata]